MYIEGNMSYNAIAKNLNNRGIKAKLGGVWGNVSIRAILMNPNYIGKVRYRMDDKEKYFEADGKHEPIIDEEIYYEVQKKMEKLKGKTLTKRPKEDNYFSGTIFCGECGAKLRTHGEYKTNKNGERIVNGNYACPNKSNGTCNNSTFSHRKAEIAFHEHMENMPDLKIKDDFQMEEKSKQDSINAMIKEEYENAISKLDKKEKDLMTFYINERITFDEYEQMIKLIVAEKNTYIENLKNIPTEPSEDIILNRSEIITNFRENWKLLTNAEKLQFLQTYIEKITAVSKREEGKYHHKVKVLKVNFYAD